MKLKVGRAGAHGSLSARRPSRTRSGESDPSLRQAAAGSFEVGVAAGTRTLECTKDRQLLTSQFSTVTPEDCMKPAVVQPEEGQFNFAPADAFVNFAAPQQLKIVGHCLVWARDNRTPVWVFRHGDRLAGRGLV